ncbi:MAG: HEAT repeat domain-containing protein [Rhodospirillaceae bacterium]|nr:HEAT repeat domain-containing protein [Rhodospirillaceae bacterium]
MKEDKDRSHAKWEEWLELSQYGELSDADQRTLDRHLEDCDRCRAYRAELDRFRMVMAQAAPARPGETDLLDARGKLRSNLTLGRIENRSSHGWMSRFVHGLQSLTIGFLPQYRTAFGGVLLLSIGLAGGYYLAFQDDRTLGFAAPGMDRTDLLNNDDVAISNVRFVDSDVSDGTLGIQFEAVRPVQIMGPVDDPEIQRVLTFAVLNEQNPGVRLRAVNAVSASERLHSDHEIRDALVTALKTDSNAGVRSEAFNALSRYPFDEEIRDAMIYALMYDDNAALRISAINRLQEQGPALFDEQMEKVLRTRMVLDENAYIRTKARTVLSNLSAP